MIKSYAPKKQASSGSGGMAAQTVVMTRVSELSNDKGYITADDLPEELDPHVSEWARQEQKPSYTAEEVGALPENTPIPDKLQDLQEDTSHRLVSDTEKNRWNSKQDAIADLAAIRSGAALGATALQSHQDISGKADVAALAGYTPTANFATVNGASITGGGNIIITAGESSITTLDASPTKDGTNPVQSGGVYDAIEGGFYFN